MRSLRKNQRTLFYALYEGKNPILDENGDYTGESTDVYSLPRKVKLNLSSGKGSARKDLFGMNIDFDRTLSTTDFSLNIVENSLIWYETEPIYLKNGSVDTDSADYVVSSKPLDALNVLVIPLKRRNKNG